MDYLKIPALVLKSKHLSLTDKLIMGYLYSMHKSDNDVFATNNYFETTFGVSKRNIQTSLSYLSGKIQRTKIHSKFIYINIKFNPQGKRVIRISPIMANLIDESLGNLKTLGTQEKLNFETAYDKYLKLVKEEKDTFFKTETNENEESSNLNFGT